MPSKVRWFRTTAAPQLPAMLLNQQVQLQRRRLMQHRSSHSSKQLPKNNPKVKNQRRKMNGSLHQVANVYLWPNDLAHACKTCTNDMKKNYTSCIPPDRYKPHLRSRSAQMLCECELEGCVSANPLVGTMLTVPWQNSSRKVDLSGSSLRWHCWSASESLVHRERHTRGWRPMARVKTLNSQLHSQLARWGSLVFVNFQLQIYMCSAHMKECQTRCQNKKPEARCYECQIWECQNRCQKESQNR